MNDLTNLISQIPENHKFLALALLFILSHADRAYRSLVLVGGLKGLATSIWSGEEKGKTPPTSSAPSNL